VARSRFYPSADVTTGELRYLQRRYPASEAAERRERIGVTLKRLVHKGHAPQVIHEALMRGTELWVAHAEKQMHQQDNRQWTANVTRARKDVARALASLRRLVPPDLRLDDDRMFELRDVLLAGPGDVAPSGTKGRPWGLKQETDQALRLAGVVAADRRELLAALGFIDDE
jgi:hypothetical protein